MSRAGFPLVFRYWTIPGPAAIRERFFADLAEGRGWCPPDPSPILWLSDLAHASASRRPPGTPRCRPRFALPTFPPGRKRASDSCSPADAGVVERCICGALCAT